jgi:hypothetical protein
MFKSLPSFIASLVALAAVIVKIPVVREQQALNLCS